MALKNYMLHHSCKPVKGHQAYFIYDLYRTKAYYASLAVGDYLSGLSNHLPQSSKNKAELSDLLQKEIIYQESSAPFKSIIPGGVVQTPDIISNLIIQYSAAFTDQKNIHALVALAEDLRIKNIQFLISVNYRASALLQIITAFSGSIVNHLELVFTATAPNKGLLEKLSLNDRIHSVMIIKKQEQLLEKKGKAIYVSDRLYMKGAHPLKFSINKHLFEESQTHHTYFHKKMYIDALGNISNAPEYAAVFMNLFDSYSKSKAEKIVASEKFRKYWNVKKDDCLVCKDCEFRHMCVDNRLPYKTKNGLWGHRESCNYNPYTNAWRQLK
jgi:hypothetical protein